MAKINGLHKYVSSIEKYWVKNFGKKKVKSKEKVTKELVKHVSLNELL